MEKTEIRRKFIIEKAADYLLVHGIKGASLRKLASAVGLSDRMLLHYFSDKKELLQATLTLLTARLVSILEGAHTERMPFQTLLHYLAGMLKNPQVRPYLRLSLELAALSAEGEESFTAIAQKICGDFLDWISLTLQVDSEEDRMPMAALAFATIEGFMVLDALDSTPVIVNAMEGIAICSK